MTDAEQELRQLERELAEHSACSGLKLAVPAADGWACLGAWRDTAQISQACRRMARESMRYLELRGMLERHPERPEWVRVK